MGIARKIGYALREHTFPYRYHNNKNKFIFIHIPKVAGTSILASLGIGVNFGREHIPSYIYKRANPQKFDTYFKFAFVRNPVERAFSAYSYFKDGGNRTTDHVIAELIKSFVSFDDFVLNGFKKGLLRNHVLFVPQSYFIVGPDQEIAVDFVGRFEKLETDFQVVLDKIGKKGLLKKVNISNRQSEIRVSIEAIAVLKQVYAQDYSVFNYDNDVNSYL